MVTIFYFVVPGKAKWFGCVRFRDIGDAAGLWLVALVAFGGWLVAPVVFFPLFEASIGIHPSPKAPLPGGLWFKYSPAALVVPALTPVGCSSYDWRTRGSFRCLLVDDACCRFAA